MADSAERGAFFVNANGERTKEPASAICNFASWRRLFRMIEAEECADTKERVIGLKIEPRGVTIYFGDKTDGR